MVIGCLGVLFPTWQVQPNCCGCGHIYGSSLLGVGTLAIRVWFHGRQAAFLIRNNIVCCSVHLELDVRMAMTIQPDFLVKLTPDGSNMKRLLAFIFAVLTGATACAEPMTFACPDALAVKHSPAERPKEGWTFVPDSGPRIFNNLEVFSGHPSRLASKKPNNEPERSSRVSAIWLFPQGTKNHWLGCSFKGTTAMLALKLPNGFARCTATYRRVGDRENDLESTGLLVCDRAISLKKHHPSN